MSSRSTEPPPDALEKSPDWASRRTSGMPLSPDSASAPSRSSLKPAHAFGLWDAVTETPPSSSREPIA
jgi:hypothetical protein